MNNQLAQMIFVLHAFKCVYLFGHLMHAIGHMHFDAEDRDVCNSVDQI